MNDYHNDFYRKNSKKFGKYEFHGQGKLVQGEQPSFLEYIKKCTNRDFTVLDFGCGSGELTLKLSPYFKEVIGVDSFKDYIKTAKRQKKKNNTKNVVFQIADGKRLPFKNEYFDIIFSSRGPLSADINFMNEGSRVLKKNGIMLEETIGEKDKSELKRIFGRGQNYPIRETKLNSVKKLLKQSGMKFIKSKCFLYYQIYPSIAEVIEILERAPIIPHFNKIKDKIYLEKVNKKFNNKNIKLSSHRLHWMARK